MKNLHYLIKKKRSKTWKKLNIFRLKLLIQALVLKWKDRNIYSNLLENFLIDNRYKK